MITVTHVALCICLTVAFMDEAFSACTFPSSMQGKWTTGSDVVKVNSTHLSGYSVDMYKSLSFTCFLTNGVDTYAMKSSDVVEMFGKYVYIYICWKVVPDTIKSCRYFELALPVSKKSHDKGRAFFPNKSPSLNSVCQQNDDGTISPRYLYKKT